MSAEDHVTPSVPIADDHGGYEGWTSCCQAAVTYSMAALVCKGCYQQVDTVPLHGKASERLALIVTDTIAGRISAEQGVARQQLLLDQRWLLAEGPG